VGGLPFAGLEVEVVLDSVACHFLVVYHQQDAEVRLRT
jgi:hypothetical protein